MKWNDYPKKSPKKSGTYIVSVTKPYQNGDYTFQYVAYFNSNTNQWHKHDSFDENNNILEIIEYRINGWASDIPIYLR